MNSNIIFMFSGQGSHYYHMGRELFQQHPVFQDWMLKLDAMAAELMEESVLAYLYNEAKRPGEPFERTRYSHPAIFMMEYALAQTLIAEGIKPASVLGTSLGEFAAAAVAGVLSPAEMLQAVVEQARLLETHCAPGGMAAVLHSPQLYFEVPLLREKSELAGINYAHHFVVSGSNPNLQVILDFLKSKEIVHQRLPVSLAFHSAGIDPAATAYLHFLRSRVYDSPRIPLLSCCYAQAVNPVSATYFWDVTRAPIKFPEMIRNLEENPGRLYIDAGPSGTLANFAKQQLSGNSPSRTFMLASPFGGEMKRLRQLLSY